MTPEEVRQFILENIPVSYFFPYTGSDAECIIEQEDDSLIQEIFWPENSQLSAILFTAVRPVEDPESPDPISTFPIEIRFFHDGQRQSFLFQTQEEWDALREDYRKLYNIQEVRAARVIKVHANPKDNRYYIIGNKCPQSKI